MRGEGWYHYPQRALRAAETPDARLSKRLICRFLRSGGHQGISLCPLLSPIGTKQKRNDLGAGTAIVRSEHPIANAVSDAVLHGPGHRVRIVAVGEHIAELGLTVDYLANSPEQEGHALGTVAGRVGAELAVTGTGGDALAQRQRTASP